MPQCICAIGPPPGQEAAQAGRLWKVFTKIQPAERSIMKGCRETWGRKKSSRLCAYKDERGKLCKLLDYLNIH